MEATSTSIMSSAASKRRPTRTFDELYEELLNAPEGVDGEIVDGEIVEATRPGPRHTMAMSDLGALLVSAFRFGLGGPGGWVILHEPGIRFGDEMRVPDLAGWRVDRYLTPEATGPWRVAPDWICECLSPTTARSDRTKKLPLYALHELRHVWLVDPAIQTLEILRLEGARWTLVATHGADAKVRAEPFDAVELDLAMIWGPPP